ncbi:MAG: DNA starvation/stationary phase protection protein Dps [Geminicoccaceae bacterium]
MHRTKNDLSANIREKAIGLLNARLSDAIDLRAQVKQAHWTVRGPSFIGLHELFDEIATRVIGHVDEIAERVTALGGVPDGTVQNVAKTTTLPPYPTDISSGPDHVEALSTALAAFGKGVRAAIAEADEIGDADTADLFTAVSRAIDQDLWFVEAHAQAKA